MFKMKGGLVSAVGYKTRRKIKVSASHYIPCITYSVITTTRTRTLAGANLLLRYSVFQFLPKFSRRCVLSLSSRAKK